MLKEIREQHGMTQEELAKLCGVTRSQIAMIEIGKNRPSFPLAEKMEEIFGIPMKEIFN